MKRFLIRLGKVLFAWFALLLLLILVQVVRGWNCQLQGELGSLIPQPQERAGGVAGIQDYARRQDDALFGYPEWYIVWSYVEKADYQEKNLPSGFPYFAAARQYWSGYCCISRLVRGKYPYNGGGHLMLVTIGASFSGEYILKGIYEKSFGRLSEWTSHHQMVEEDRYAATVAREYAEFTKIRPFYEFHFAHAAAQLWKQTPLWGQHIVRKWERKAFLTTDYLCEGAYSWAMEKASHLSFGHEPDTTFAWVENAPDSLFRELPRIRKIRQTAPGAYIVEAPRYQEFTAVALALAQRRVRFIEIAGNTQIPISLVAPSDWQYPRTKATTLFSAPVLTRPGYNRIVLVCPVSSLSAVLNELRPNPSIILEHLYDY